MATEFKYHLTKVPALPNGRPETGPMQFGDDWPGVFIRGDNALYDSYMLNEALKLIPEDRWDIASVLRGLLHTLQSCNAANHRGE